MKPAPVNAIRDMSMQRDDGILSIHCMSTKSYLKFYNEDKYWNLDVKEEFINETRSLWRNNGTKHEGEIFNSGASKNEEIGLVMAKVDKELEEAIKKHGMAVEPKKY